MQNKLWFGDNLTVLWEEIPDASVDLVYLDPPFNSKANYNVLFKTPDDEAASAQVEAFRDTWTWGPEAQWAYDEVMRTGGGITSIIYALHSSLGQSDMMAYLVMMAQRLHELRRVLKPTGSDKYQFQWWANYLVGVQALKEVRRGPDRGIDGQMFFMNGPRGWGRILTSVKGGQHVGTKDVREFKAVISR